MLRKRSRAVSSKQSMMPDPPPLLSPTVKYSSPTSSSLFASPNIFVGFSSKGSSDTEAAMSPTSILETKPFSSIKNPFFSDKNPRNPAESKQHPWDNGDSRAVGLGIVDALRNDVPDKKSCKPGSRMVLFGSQLKIQIPASNPTSISPTGSVEDSPHSLAVEFGIKNKNSQLALLSPAVRTPMGSANVDSEVFTGCLSATEMELSEDYTCVISHGPNPRTTHIFDNCIVESHGDAFSPLQHEIMFLADHSVYPSDDFLTCCYACKKKLGQGKDIFMYRGDKAFCSSECRHQEMLYDEEMEKASSDSSGTL